MKVRFIRPWRTYSPGHVIEPPGVLRDWLQARGYVERIETPAADVSHEVETASTQPPANTKRKRGRPRKVQVPT